jgi:plasmid stabilization system protein ParE
MFKLEVCMARGDKDKYSATQKRKAEHIENSYGDKGVPKGEAEKRAWATVNKQSGGGEKGGSGEHTPEKKKTIARKDSAKRAVDTKKKNTRSTSAGGHTKAELLNQARARNIAGRSTMTKEELERALAKS